MERSEAVRFLLDRPAELGHLVGFNKLVDLHNDWIVDMIRGSEDKTLQAHRGSYKTTCVSIALSCCLILLPNRKTMFMRKTTDDVKEVIAQVKKIVESPQLRYLCRCIYDVDLKLVTSTAYELSTNLSTDIRGTSQLVGLGMGGSLTGKHYDRIFTDDIVNIQDRISKAERDRTKLIYQELRNIINRDGRIFNTGTPWHKDDAFTQMPNPERFDCYSTGLISPAELEEIKTHMTSSLFAANYELRHVADEDIIFGNPHLDADPAMVEQGECHIDAAYGGEDWTAFTICRKFDGKYYVFGQCWQKHVDDVEDEIIKLRKQFMCGRIFCENNGDKGYLAKELRKKGERVVVYHEDMNKYLKIITYLKSQWENIYFVSGTSPEYINQICDYTENAEHDDCPDSLASLIRKLWAKRGSEEKYVPKWM